MRLSAIGMSVNGSSRLGQAVRIRECAVELDDDVFSSTEGFVSCRSNCAVDCQLVEQIPKSYPSLAMIEHCRFRSMSLGIQEQMATVHVVGIAMKAKVGRRTSAQRS